MTPLLRTLAGALIAVFALAAQAQAGAGRDRLDDFLKDLRSLQADFRQVLIDEERRPLEESSGIVYLERPGRFRWDYQGPYPQLIVADGSKLWLYDPELLQVTVKPQTDTLGATPAALLSSTRPVEESFEVQELGARDDGSVWLALKPKDPEAAFSGIRLGFLGADLTTMELTDGFGQITRLEFSAVSRNPALDPSLFRFEPPAGVDVVEGR